MYYRIYHRTFRNVGTKISKIRAIRRWKSSKQKWSETRETHNILINSRIGWGRRRFFLLLFLIVRRKPYTITVFWKKVSEFYRCGARRNQRSAAAKTGTRPLGFNTRPVSHVFRIPDARSCQLGWFCRRFRVQKTIINFSRFLSLFAATEQTERLSRGSRQNDRKNVTSKLQVRHLLVLLFRQNNFGSGFLHFARLIMTTLVLLLPLSTLFPLWSFWSSRGIPYSSDVHFHDRNSSLLQFPTFKRQSFYPLPTQPPIPRTVFVSYLRSSV